MQLIEFAFSCLDFGQAKTSERSNRRTVRRLCIVNYYVLYVTYVIIH
jgi:hypothetical protein